MINLLKYREITRNTFRILKGILIIDVINEMGGACGTLVEIKR